MQLNIYSLLDTKTGVWSHPWFFHHDALVYRAIGELGQDKNASPGRYPNDYCVYRIGWFDDTAGTVHAQAPVNMGTVSAILATSDPAVPNMQ